MDGPEQPDRLAPVRVRAAHGSRQAMGRPAPLAVWTGDVVHSFGRGTVAQGLHKGRPGGRVALPEAKNKAGVVADQQAVRNVGLRRPCSPVRRRDALPSSR